MLPDLLDQIPADEPVGIVTADGAYDTRACHAAIAARGGCSTRQERQALEGTHGRSAGRNETLRVSQRIGRAIWRRWSGYHRRSLVEAKMRCLKRL